MTPLEKILSDYIGAQVLNLAKLTVEVETLKSELAKYKPVNPPRVPIVGEREKWMAE